ncbi:hypothetical protein A1O3_10228 [Capronia epimyces CBS 606.96]|uniref:Uncharacterized protein n=1 Tax=Capronia epimyces CBS 606.96 TaxID=1182542 RepID=W9XI94_9EURO|nr:uncharacterized protein A1O3_10228 [Capronia epimyces CBS 606.96]EXJ77070.1 hypothetical protein A1O3_10228 [Capronia epimyces CBS 606.96]
MRTLLSHRSYSWLRVSSAVATLAVVLLLYIVLDAQARRSWWAVSSSFRARPTNPFTAADLDQHLDITEWGEMGRRVKKLSQWAQILIKHPSADHTAFQDTLVLHFPFLAGTEASIYTPWSSPINRSFPSHTGIITCVGSNNFRMAGHLIASLRLVHNSQIPIEIAYAGDEDLDPDSRAFLQSLDPELSFIDLLDLYPAAGHDLVRSGWAMKPFALLASSHPQAILVDADAVFLTNPESIFEENAGLARTGTLFFHDRAARGGDGHRRLWLSKQIRAAGIPPSRHLTRRSLFYSGAAYYEADSGVVALDKSRPSVLLGLMFACWMNTKNVRDEVTYRVFHGDKETFWVAAELSSVEYFFQPWYAGTMGTITTAEGEGQDQPPDLAVDKVEINGGIYEDKSKVDKGFAQMTHYWVGEIEAETANIRLTGLTSTQPQHQWYWRPGSVSCLRETGVKVIPDDIQRTIERIEKEAGRVDELAMQ